MFGFVCQGPWPHTILRELRIIWTPRPKPGGNPELEGGGVAGGGRGGQCKLTATPTPPVPDQRHTFFPNVYFIPPLMITITCIRDRKELN